MLYIFYAHVVVEYYCNDDYTVNTCEQDISKAFDRVDQYALLNLMIDRGIPKCIISLMLDWFKKSTAMIRWRNSLSKKFSINASVQQGGLLSSVFIAIYVDTSIQKLKQTSVCYNINGQFFGCLFYVDIILLAQNVTPNLMQLCQ